MMIRVKNRKVIARLSRRNLLHNRTRNAVAVFAIALTTLLFTALFTIAQSFIHTTQQETFRQVGGSFHGGFKDLTLEEKEILEIDPLIRQSGGRLMLGMACGNNFRKVHAELCYMDQTCRKSSFCEPQHGNAPKEGSKEIACDTRILRCLDIKPEIGAPVTLSYEIGGMEKETITESFRLSGWWEYDAANNASMAILPRSYIETVLEEHKPDFTDAANHTGLWTLDVFLDNSLHIEDTMIQILESHGYQGENPNAENYIGIGVNWGYAGAQMAARNDPETILGIIVLAILIILTGYLIINNIFQISVSGDIRFYGLLKTIGTTKKQIRRMIRRQALLLCAIGIPIGLLLGYLCGILLAPWIISSINDNIKTITHASHLWIFALAAAFSLATVLLSCAKPGRIAAKVSPIEAVRYTETSSLKGQRKRSRKKTNAFWMALNNLGRSKKKTFLVVASLALSVVSLQLTYTFATGFDMDKYLEKWVVSDFILGDAAYFQSNFQGSKQAVPKRDVLAMWEGGEIIEQGMIYGTKTGVLEYVTEDLYREHFSGTDAGMLEEMLESETRNEDGKVPITADIYGMEEYPLSQLEVFDGDLTDLYRPGKNVIAAVYLDDDYGNPLDFSQWAKTGDTVKIHHVYEWEFSDAENGEIIPEEKAKTYHKEINVKEKDYQDVSYEVVACVLVKNAMSYRSFGNHQFILNADVYQQNCRNSDVMAYLFNTTENDTAAMQSYLENYTTTVNPALDFESKQTYVNSFLQYRNMYLMVGECLSFVIGLIGVLNFFNAILTSIYARRREFAMLQSIGMTGRQLKQMLICEGFLYGIFTIAVSAILSILAIPVMSNTISSMFWFFTYHFTALPLLIVVPIFAALGFILPLVSYRNAVKQTIVERLRMGE